LPAWGFGQAAVPSRWPKSSSSRSKIKKKYFQKYDSKKKTAENFQLKKNEIKFKMVKNRVKNDI